MKKQDEKQEQTTEPEVPVVPTAEQKPEDPAQQEIIALRVQLQFEREKQHLENMKTILMLLTNIGAPEQLLKTQGLVINTFVAEFNDKWFPKKPAEPEPEKK